MSGRFLDTVQPPDPDPLHMQALPKAEKEEKKNGTPVSYTVDYVELSSPY